MMLLMIRLFLYYICYYVGYWSQSELTESATGGFTWCQYLSVCLCVTWDA